MVAALALAGPAAAGEARSPQLTNAMSLAAGSAVDVSCEPNTLAWDEETRRVLGMPGTMAQGYTLRTTRQVRLAPWVCSSLTPSSSQFGAALYVLGAEAARVAGHQAGAEAVVGCWALTWVAALAHHVWKVPAAYVRGGATARAAATFSATALGRVVAAARAMHARTLPQYRAVCR